MAKSYDQYCPIAHALDLVGRALVAAHRPRAPRGRAAPLLGPPRPARGLRHEHPRRAAEDARAGRRRPPPSARPPCRLVGLRAHRIRQGLRAVLHVLAHWGAHSLGPPAAATISKPGGWPAHSVSRSPRRAGATDRVPDRRRGRVCRTPTRSSPGAWTSPTPDRGRSLRLLPLWSTATSMQSRSKATTSRYARMLASLPRAAAPPLLPPPNARRSRRGVRSSRGSRCRRCRLRRVVASLTAPTFVHVVPRAPTPRASALDAKENGVPGCSSWDRRELR